MVGVDTLSRSAHELVASRVTGLTKFSMTVDVEPQLKKRRMSDSAQHTPSSQLLVKRLSEKAKLPTRGSPLAAGYDLYRYDVPLLL